MEIKTVTLVGLGAVGATVASAINKASVTDLVIIATKNLQLAQVLGQLKNSVGPDTVILSLLNGIQSERDIVAVANSEGIALTSQIVEDQLKFFEENEPWGKTSMHQDIEAGRKTENQWFCGTIEKLGAAHNIPTPYCSLLKQLITSKEAVNDYKI